MVWKRLRDCRQTDRFRTRPCFMPIVQVQCRCSGLEAEVCLRDRSCIHGDLGAITCSRHPPNYCFCRGLSVTLSQADKSSLQTMLRTVIAQSGSADHNLVLKVSVPCLDIIIFCLDTSLQQSGHPVGKVNVSFKHLLVLFRRDSMVWGPVGPCVISRCRAASEPSPTFRQ